MKTYNDPAKQKSRVKIREFIRANSDHKPLEDFQVVCFPGAEQKGEEGLEIFEIYDELGIPRENIVGLEIDPQRAERLEQANLGIQVINSSDVEFLQSTDRQFDVVSLDYRCNYNWGIIDALAEIAGRQVIADNGIFTMNLLGRRERRALSTHLKGINLNYKNPYDSAVSEEVPNLRDLSFGKDTRSYGMSMSILTMFHQGRNCSGGNPIFKAALEYELIQDEVEQQMESLLESPEEPELKDNLINTFERFKKEKYCSIPLYNGRHRLQQNN